MVTQDDLFEIEIENPWVGDDEFRLAAGRFILYDHADHIQYGLSMGGQLEITLQEDYTVCTLQSSAPIFLLQDDPEGADILLADEIDSLLARRRAAWGIDSVGFAHKIAAADPRQLLPACLDTIEERLKRIMVVRHEGQYATLENFINHIHRGLDEAGEWPVIYPELESLL